MLLLLIVLALLPQAKAANVALLLSDHSGPYSEFSSSFLEHSRKTSWKVTYVDQADALATTTGPSPDLLIAVGSSALRSALHQGGNTPILATLVPRQSYEKILAEFPARSTRGQTSAIFLDQPVARLGSLIRQLLPTAQRIGLLGNSETRAALPVLRKALAPLTLDHEEVSSDASLLGDINNLLPRVAVLLALPDSKIYKRDNIKPILVTSFRHQRPVIAFSKAFVSAGALAAVYSTPAQIARQASDLLSELPAGPVSLPPTQAPRYFAISINYNVAESFALELPDEASVYEALKADGATR
ncbi:MAG: ABC transporter substrate binding protein [Rhodocyclaceae bacterium]|nr:ABC transporter substrate binding protein [Rhodocyclaceae bacterium]